MHYVLALLIVVLAALGLILLNRDAPREAGPPPSLPWQIETLADGSTRVFGIIPGQSTFAEAIDELGDGMELAIIAAPGETGTLEAYYSHYTAGLVTGSVILVLDVARGRLAAMRERATRDGGTRRYYLHPDDLELAYRAPVRYITFMPGLDLDVEIARLRFGEPAEVIEISPRQQHLLYPQLGLDLILNTDGRDVLQYLSPHEFGLHRLRMQGSMSAGE